MGYARELYIRHGDTFTVTPWSWDDADVPPERELERASREHGEAFFFEFSSSAEGFGYDHWIGGRRVRRLVLMNGQFPVQVGTAQPWEWAALFDWRETSPDVDREPAFWRAFTERRLPSEHDDWQRSLSTKQVCATLLEYYLASD